MALIATRHEAKAELYLRPGGPWDVPDLDTLLGDGARRGGAVLVDGTHRWDADALEEAVAAVAGGLREQGIGRGDVVAWQLPNGATASILARACWRLGAIAAPLHHRSGAPELAPSIDRLAPAILLAGSHVPMCSDAAAVVLSGPARPGGPSAGLPWGAPVTQPAADGSDLALAQLTSGSTGSPKVVLHSHRSLGAKTVQMVAAHGLGPGDATLVQSPMSHISGVLNGILVPQAAGMNQVLVDRWDPEAAVRLVRDEAVSFMVGPPTVFLSLMDEAGADREALSTLRLVSCGGTGVTPEFVADASSRLGAVVKRSYGCTEVPTVTTAAVGDPSDAAATTDGRALGDTELRVVDPATRVDVAVGDIGELWVRGPELFAGYAELSQTEDSMENGWFRTGDLGTLHPQGWLTVVGRIKDVIIRGGENISPAEVERVLESHPSVQQAVVVGVPDDRLGERVAAFLVADADLDPQACLGWFTSQGMAKFKSPELVERLESLPVLSLGKPDRSALRTRAAELFG